MFAFKTQTSIAGGSPGETYTQAQMDAVGLTPGQIMTKAPVDSAYGPDRAWILAYNASGAAHVANYCYAIGGIDTTDNKSPAAVTVTTPAASDEIMVGVAGAATPDNEWGWYLIQGQCTITLASDTYLEGEGLTIDISEATGAEVVGTNAAYTHLNTEFAYIKTAIAVAATSGTAILTGNLAVTVA